MSWLSDIAGLFGSGSSSTAVATTSNNTSVTVNPTILNAIDFSSLEAPAQKLVDTVSGIGGAIAGAGRSVGDAIKSASEKQSQSADMLKEVAVWVSLAGIAFALIRIVRG
jgi:hypothetical protein